MPDLGPPPEYLRDAFRDYLIRNGGASGLSGLGHAEDLKRFNFYLDTFEQFISAQESAEISTLEAEAAKLSEEGRSEFWSWYYPVHWDEVFRTNLRSSFLISLVSMVESQLTEVCRDAAVIARTPIQLSDLKGNLLERAKLFLEKFASFGLPSGEAWNTISQIYDVRNVFVHHAGFLPSYNHAKRVHQFINTAGGLTETNGFLTLQREFCPFALDVAQVFLGAISAELSALCGRVRKFEG